MSHKAHSATTKNGVMDMGGSMRTVSFHIPDEIHEKLVELVSLGWFSSRSEAIRYGLMLLLEHFKMLPDQSLEAKQQ